MLALVKFCVTMSWAYYKMEIARKHSTVNKTIETHCITKKSSSKTHTHTHTQILGCCSFAELIRVAIEHLKCIGFVCKQQHHHQHQHMCYFGRNSNCSRTALEYEKHQKCKQYVFRSKATFLHPENHVASSAIPSAPCSPFACYVNCVCNFSVNVCAQQWSHRILNARNETDLVVLQLHSE